MRRRHRCALLFSHCHFASQLLRFSHQPLRFNRHQADAFGMNGADFFLLGAGLR